jgi:hypothetical protein
MFDNRKTNKIWNYEYVRLIDIKKKKKKKIDENQRYNDDEFPKHFKDEYYKKDGVNFIF